MRALVLVALAAATPVRADHDHGAMAPAGSSYAAGLALVAASYDTMFYGGDYEGAIASFRWSYDRFGAAASASAYRLVGNGRTTFGLGDVVVHGQVMLAGDRALAVGLAVGLGLPTGDSRPGLGMGHPMIMPAAFVSAARGRVRLAGSAGYGRALGGDHEHGAWPLVDPMSRSELTFSSSGDLAIAHDWQLGMRLLAAIPTSDSPVRAIGAGRVGWTAGRFDTAVELQAGLAGDPFHLRGLVQTAFRF